MRPVPALAPALMAVVISANFGPELAHALSSVDPMIATMERVRSFIRLSLGFDEERLTWNDGGKRSFHGKVESHHRLVTDDDVGLVNVRALHRDDLVSGPVDVSLHEMSDELPSGARTQRRRIAGGQRDFGGPIQSEAL